MKKIIESAIVFTVFFMIGWQSQALGKTTQYYVYGTTSERYQMDWWKTGLNPGEYGYTLLGFSDQTDTFENPQNYSIFIIWTDAGSTAWVDAIEVTFRNGLRKAGSVWFEWNTEEEEETRGFPDQKCGEVGGSNDPPIGGFLLIGPYVWDIKPYFITVYLCQTDSNSKYFGTFDTAVAGTQPNGCNFSGSITIGNDMSQLNGRCDYFYIPTSGDSVTYSFVDCGGDEAERTINISGYDINIEETGQCDGVQPPCWTDNFVLSFNDNFLSGNIDGNRYVFVPAICQGAMTGSFSNVDTSNNSGENISEQSGGGSGGGGG